MQKYAPIITSTIYNYLNRKGDGISQSPLFWFAQHGRDLIGHLDQELPDELN